MSSTLDNIINIVPEKDKYTKISFDKKLAEMALNRWDLIESQLEFRATHSFKNIDYRWATSESTVYGSTGGDTYNEQKETGLSLEEEIIPLLGEDLVNHLGLKYFMVNEIRFEKTGPNEFLNDVHLKFDRYKKGK